MSLSAGTKLGPYEILAPIGAGGMGEVYRARDTKLNRDVAIKVLPVALTNDVDYMARFQREAQVLASLNHPNIAAIYGLEEHAIVMELVEGLTLAERIVRGLLPIEEALPIAKQIAEALEAAHEKGIIHRDLKPANIKVTPSGQVKVLDFGLAAVTQGSAVASGNSENSPTLTLMGATQAGLILGTASYMSPEQAAGKPVDKRADIWSFGVVLYELLTGKRLFQGETVSHTLASVLQNLIDFDALPKKTPSSIKTLLKRCLDRNVRKRLRDIGEARFWLEEPAAAEPPVVSITASRSRLGLVPWAVAGVLALALVALAAVQLREKPPAAELIRFQIPLPEKAAFYAYVGVSPDGRKLAFTATGPDGRNAIWVRSLDGLESRMVAGTAGMSGEPFWSPDGRYLGFGVEGKLKIVDVSGGPPKSVCDAKSAVVGGFWTGDGRIVFGSGSGFYGLWMVPAAGGVASQLTAIDTSRQEVLHLHPSPLPDGRHFLYHRASHRPENDGVFIGSLDAKPEAQSPRMLLASPFAAVYANVPNARIGRLLFLRDGTLMAQPFDASKMALAGEPVPLAEHVGSYRDSGLFQVSSNGVLVYRGGNGSNTQLTWFDREGKILGVEAEPGDYAAFALSPNEARVAVERADRTNRDIWIHDRGHGSATRFTFDPALDRMPVWSPDGSHIAFTSNRDGPYNLYQKLSSGAGEDELLLKSSEPKYPSDWSRDGRFLLYSQNDPKTQWDLWVLTMAGDRKAMPVLQTQFNETMGQFSPDNCWIAYTSDESGRQEIYVRPFPPSLGSGKWMISNGGGTQARWRRDGRELLYVSPDRKLMSVEVATSPTFRSEVAKMLFPMPIVLGTIADFRWDISADGKRFLVNSTAVDTASEPITVVLNWTAGLKK